MCIYICLVNLVVKNCEIVKYILCLVWLCNLVFIICYFNKYRCILYIL